MQHRGRAATASRTTEATSAHAIRSSELLQLLVERVLDYAIFALDAEGRVATWNAGAERLKGYTAREIVGQHFSVFYPEADRLAGKPERELETATREGSVEDEGWRVRKDGSRFWADVVITALRDAHGNLVGFAKVTRDLTARRAAEEQARRLAAEEAARTATTQLNEQLQRQTEELEAQQEEGQTLAEELEQTNEELEGKVHEAQRARAAAEQAEQRMRFLVRAGDLLASTVSYDERLKGLAQLVVPDLADWCVVEVADGAPRQVAVAHKDPEKIKWARELSERYPPDPAGTRGVPQVLRTGKPELYAEISDEMLAANAKDAEHLRLLKQLRLKSVMIVPLIARDHTLGAMTLVSAESGRVFDQGDVAFAMELARRAAIAVDNARLHAETVEALKATEQANRAKSQFLAVMSHELRTPLNAIAGYADLLRLGVRGPVNDEQAKALDRILENEHGLLALINNILNFTRLEAGRVEINPRSVPVRELLRGIDGMVLPQLEAKKLHFAYQEPDPALVVSADADKVRQILLNLLSNAINFTPEGGRITLSVAADEKVARVAVADTGVGIPADKRSTIFDPFVQLERSLTSEQRGSGLGLTISRELARGMKGDLVVESTVGKGSTFTLVLPRAASGS